jgi:ATP-dependent Clp protease ATP-binding subunit ClpC
VFERFTDRARRVLVLAQEEARLLNHSFIGTEHLLLSLLHEGEGIAARALDQLQITLEEVREKIEDTVGGSDGLTIGSPPFTPREKMVLELSLREALQLDHNYIGTEHMLLGILREGEGVAARILLDVGSTPDEAREAVLTLLSELPPEEQAPPHLTRRSGRQAPNPSPSTPEKWDCREHPAVPRSFFQSSSCHRSGRTVTSRVLGGDSNVRVRHALTRSR